MNRIVSLWLVVCAVGILLCANVRAGDNVYESTRKYKGQEYQILLAKAHFGDRPTYDPNKHELPVSLTKLVATAKEQMTCIEPDAVTWEVFCIELVRSKVGTEVYWYFRVGLVSNRGDEFVTCLTPRGEPASLVKVTRTRMNK
jgi:hypothetical protein